MRCTYFNIIGKTTSNPQPFIGKANALEMAVKGEAASKRPGNHAAVLRIEEVPDGPLLRFTILDLMGSNFNIHLVQHSLEFFQQRRNSESGVTFVLFHAISACRLAESVSGEKRGQST